MTPQNAIFHLSMKHICDEVARQEAIKALEKQIPCKLAPKESNKAEIPVCGKCGGIMDLMQGELNYCPNCGQAIDWSDYNG